MKNIKKEQIKNLFNNFIDTIYYGIWFSGIKGYGKYKAWYKNNQLSVDSYYKNTVRIGKCKEWYENGQICIDVNYNEKGELDDICKEWNKNGDLLFEIEFKNNELIIINYINSKYIDEEYWFSYYDQIQGKWINFYNKIKEIYNNGKYKKKTN